MHPILSNAARLRVFVVIWIPVGALVGLLPFWAAGGGRLIHGWPFIVWGESLAVPVLASWYVCRFIPVSAGPGRVFPAIGAAAVTSAALWLAVGRVWLWTVASVAPAADALFPLVAAPAFGASAVIVIVMSAVHYTLAAAEESAVARRRALETDITARESELRALRAQIDPHFLFNCLHSISALVGSSPADARRMCLDLADFFRDSLRVGSQPRIRLGLEAALVERYLGIEQVRFGDRLRVAIAVQPDAEDVLVPPLLLQPLAENAVRHGIATVVGGGDVRIAIARRGDRVTVRIDNPYDSADTRPGAGIGLANVRARLDATYGDRADFHVDANGSQFSAVLSLPAEDAV